MHINVCIIISIFQMPRTRPRIVERLELRFKVVHLRLQFVEHPGSSSVFSVGRLARVHRPSAGRLWFLLGAPK